MVRVDEEDVVSIAEYFQELDDPRSTINRKHLLGDLIVISICAVIAGADGPKAIGLWANANEAWLKERLQLPGGVPSHDTIGRMLAVIQPQAFQACFAKWIGSLQAGDTDDVKDSEATPVIEQIAIDGKALRRSHDRRRGLGPLFLVSAWSVRQGLSLGQLATAEKSNEITAIPELLENIDVSGAIVTIDAAGCQKNIADRIIEEGGDYVLALKDNHPKLHEAVIDLIEQHIDNDLADLHADTHQVVVKGHGRLDTLTYYQFLAPMDLPGRDAWRGLQTIGITLRESQRGEKTTIDTRYFLCSLPPDVKQFAAAARGHWGIENTLHWCLDVTFREDECRVRNRHAAENLAWLKRFAISLLKQCSDKESIAMRRRMAAWNIDYLTQVLGLTAL